MDGPSVGLALTGSASIPERDLDLKGTASLMSGSVGAAAPLSNCPSWCRVHGTTRSCLPDPQSRIQRSGAAAPILIRVRRSGARDAVRSAIERLTGTAPPSPLLPPKPPRHWQGRPRHRKPPPRRQQPCRPIQLRAFRRPHDSTIMQTASTWLAPAGSSGGEGASIAGNTIRGRDFLARNRSFRADIRARRRATPEPRPGLDLQRPLSGSRLRARS